jgi:hypothetical protein
MRKKGLEDAVNVVVTVNTTLGVQAFSLDIYGQVDREQTECIASDWKYNTELVNENVDFVYPTGDQYAFLDIL